MAACVRQQPLHLFLHHLILILFDSYHLDLPSSPWTNTQPPLTSSGDFRRQRWNATSRSYVNSSPTWRATCFWKWISRFV